MKEKTPITPELVEKVYIIWEKIFNSEIRKCDGVKILTDEFGENKEGTIKNFIANLNNMHKGKKYGSAMKDTDKDILLSNILRDFGADVYKKAQSAVEKRKKYEYDYNHDKKENVTKKTEKINSINNGKDKQENKANKATNEKSDNNSQDYSIQIRKYLDEIISKLLMDFLNASLPKISNNWWEEKVLINLTDLQKLNVKRNNICSLDGLDIASMLRIFDLNWSELSQQHTLLYADRNILKEMQAVRNRWSHKPTEGYSLDDIQRDFDTMQRFYKILGGNQKIIDEFQKIKLDIWAEMK